MFTNEQIMDICPVLTSVEILYWSNILLNCWCVARPLYVVCNRLTRARCGRFGIIASKQILSKIGVMSYAVANAFTAVSYFVLLLNLSVRYDVWWFTYAAFWCVV